ncbi:MAG: Ku protein [Planctomycetota bacterium]
MPRPSWKGFLRLSLVSVPVKAYTTNVTSKEIRLRQLHEECHSPVKYQKTCPIHGELSMSDIVSGYEYSKGQFVVIDTDEISKLRTESDKSIAIDGFIDPEQVDSLYLTGKSYFLVPDGAIGQRPYSLLLESMKGEGVAAIAKVVLSGREQIAFVRPVDGVLTMEILAFEATVKKPESFEDEITHPELSKNELQLAQTLIQASKIEELDLASYEDHYTQQLTQLIEAKVAGQEIVAAPQAEEPRIIDLMEALKRSVAEAGVPSPPSAGKKKASKKKLAPSSRGSKKKTARKKKSG